jgi:hypothetical protein
LNKDRPVKESLRGDEKVQKKERWRLMRRWVIVLRRVKGDKMEVETTSDDAKVGQADRSCGTQ